MKRLIIIAVVMICVTANIAATNIMMESNLSEQNSNKTTEDDGWIIIGEVTLSNIHQYSDTIIAQLYVREIANKLIYRVGYKGDFYSTRWHDDSKTYHVTVNGKTYRCDVPAGSSTEDDSRNEAKFVGKWRLGRSGWYVDISYSNGKYNYNLNTDEIGELTNIQEISNGIIFTFIRKFDKRPELRSKGLKFYYNERDNKADAGYPTTGRYEYDREIVYYTESICLSDKAPIRKVIKMQTFYYLGSTLTYADTDTDFNMPGFTTELTKLN